eukprot:CAMPEP_0169090408 /NCGR_PEP_ID=MMETSP1015-20121227/15801_1 /TAXON_ID=342587 /ORGANISM="Karlodinium micrum, Strain CCMP2283" /LENGTH=146 /DNA_ID=CAMNT_0009150807 /DNA_START=49 /DNA_END=486 /DNA_ORIENTATION=+
MVKDLPVNADSLRETFEVAPPPRGHDVSTVSDRCTSILPSSIHKFRKLRLPAEFGGDVDFIEIEGHQPIEAISGDWHSNLVKDGILCSAALVLFDANNASGREQWEDAVGKIVVAMRGNASFEVITRNAEDSGAVAVIIVDSEPVW